MFISRRTAAFFIRILLLAALIHNEKRRLSFCRSRVVGAPLRLW